MAACASALRGGIRDPFTAASINGKYCWAHMSLSSLANCSTLRTTPSSSSCSAVRATTSEAPQVEEEGAAEAEEDDGARTVLPVSALCSTPFPSIAEVEENGQDESDPPPAGSSARLLASVLRTAFAVAAAD